MTRQAKADKLRLKEEHRQHNIVGEQIEEEHAMQASISEEKRSNLKPAEQFHE